MVLRLPDSWTNWNLEMLVFEERGKPANPEKNLSEQGREPTTNSTHIWRRRRDLNPGRIGGRRVLSPLHHPCSPCGLIQYGLFTFWKFRFVFHLWLQAVYLSFSTLCSNTVEPPESDHPKCKGLMVAYESRTARAKVLSQTRIEWYTYSKKIMKVYFPLPINGRFIDKIVCYSMWQFIYGSALTIR